MPQAQQSENIFDKAAGSPPAQASASIFDQAAAQPTPAQQAAPAAAPAPQAPEGVMAAIAGPGTFLGTQEPKDSWSFLFHHPIEFAEATPRGIWDLASKPIVNVQALLPAEAPQEHPFWSAVARTSSGFTTPTNVALAGLLGPIYKAGAAGDVAAQAVSRWASATFAGLLGLSAGKDADKFANAYRQGDANGMLDAAGQFAATAPFAVAAGAHAIMGGAAPLPSEQPKPVGDVFEQAALPAESQPQPAGNLPELNPAEHADLEEQAGRSLTNEQAQELRLRNVQNGAVVSMLSKGKELSGADVAASLDETITKPAAGAAVTAPRGPVTFEQQAQLADNLGLGVDDLLKQRAGEGVNAETVVRGNAMLSASLQNMMWAFDGAKDAAPDSPEMKQALDALAQHKLIAEQVKGKIFSEAGRALGATRNTPLSSTVGQIADSLSKMSGTAQSEMVQRFAQLDKSDPGAVARFAAEVKPSSTGQKIYEGWINSLLTGGAIVKKAVADTTMLMKAPVEKLAGGEPRAALNNILGVLSSFPDAVDRFSSTFQDEVSQVHGEFESPQVANKGELGKAVRLPVRALGALTDFFNALNYGGSIAEQAGKIARSERLTGDDLTSRVAELRANPTAEMKARAGEYAQSQTFQQPTSLSNYLNAGKNKFALMKVLMPFVKTPLNIARASVDFSPAGFLTAAARSMKAGELDNMGIGRAVLGSAAFMWALHHANAGLLSGAGPSNSGDRLRLMAQGWQPYSLRIGNNWVSYKYWEPVAPVMGAAADLAQYERENPGADLSARVVTGIGLGMRDAADMLPFANTLTNISDVFKSANGIANGAAKFAGREAGSLIPTAVADIAHMRDRVIRAPKGFLQELENRIPGLTGNVPPLTAPAALPGQRGVAGRGPALQNPASAAGGFNPFPVSQSKPGLATMQELVDYAAQRRAQQKQNRPGLPFHPGAGVSH